MVFVICWWLARSQLLLFEPSEHCLFFFQAEDGIRDSSVTGVQTCALPIYSIYHPVIGIRTLTVDTELSVRGSTARRKHDAGRELNQRLKTPAIQWQVLGELTVHDGADRRIRRVDVDAACFHCNRFGHRTKRHMKIELHSVLHMQHERWLDDPLKALLVYLNTIGAGD